MANSRDFTGKNRKFTGTKGIVTPKGTTAERVGAESGELRFNTTTELMEYYDGTAWKAIDAPPTISGITTNDSVGTSTVLNADGSTLFTITINGGNFSLSPTVKFVGSTGTEYSAGNVTRVSGSQITCKTTSTMGTTDDPYDVRVTNTSGLSATLDDAFSYNAAPVFVTSAGSLGTVYDGVAASLSSSAATDAEGNTITYSIISGSLPGSGLSLSSSTGLITGTLGGTPSLGNYSFTIRAATTEGNSERNFSILVGALPSGGTVTTSGAYRIHTFTSSSNFVVPANFSITSADILLVAGGASGGGTSSPYGGGGGAGGLIFSQSQSIVPGTYSAVIGSGGSAAAPNNLGNNGQNTTFVGSTAIGGGGGGIQDGGAGKSGGSGGGGGYAYSGGAGTSGQGFPGGAGNTSPNGGGGGGGATAVGFTNNPCDGGAGRNLSSTFGSGVGASGIFAGGGGGTNQAGYPTPAGGVGGGGQGKVYNSTGATPGTAATGGGGGGGGNGENGRAGGSGVVIVRYPF